ncbi:hypothetical protein ACFYY3_08305 [Streptomyces sp. NPDC001812]|uniref:hypothetical protein n=1 Tax=Streptomyces sp. NPDC001812 TaxID=3364611 RepID=UPI0036766DB9
MTKMTADDIAHAAALSGLPADLVELLAGETREELTENAKRVAAAIGFAPKGQR